MPRINFAFATQAELTRAVRVWQKRLRLQDWDVTVRFARASDFGSFGQIGSCDTNIRNHEATISILDAIDFDEHYECAYDAEETLVHELCHLLLARLTSQFGDDVTDDEEEVAVNKLAQALVKAYRQ